MKKNKILILVVLGLFVLVIPIVYWFYFSKPDPFPAKKHLISEINSVYPEAEARIIQDTLHMDDRHVLLPFISKNGSYGLSYWVWKNHKWGMASVDTKGEPRIWEINKKDPSTFRFVWNLDPNDHLNHLKFFFIKDRNFLVSDGKETYYPRLQMEKKVSLIGKSYGVQKLPNDWIKIMNSLLKIESAQQPGVFLLNNSIPDQYFGWNPYDEKGKEMIPQGSMNGNEYTNGDEDISFIRIINETELESK